MKSQDGAAARRRQMSFALMCMAATAVLLPAGAMAKDTGACTPGTTLRLSAPDSSQGSLLLIEVKSAKPLVEVQGDWDGRSVPFWREVASEAQRKGLLGVDLEKEPGEYELKITGQLASGGKISCTARVTVRKGRFATEKLQVGKQFVEPSPEQIKRADEERQKLRDIFDRVAPERLWDGKFRIPLDGVTTGSNFGRRRILNGNPGSPHGGVDLPGATGTPVHAAQRGRVVLAEELFFAGNTVVVDHGLGIYTFYGHLSAIDAKVGDDLEAGTVLGKVGATGRVTGPHLHWGLTVERARVNPLQLVTLLGNSSGKAARQKSSKPRTNRKGCAGRDTRVGQARPALRAAQAAENRRSGRRKWANRLEIWGSRGDTYRPSKGGDGAALKKFLAPDVVLEEFPNLLTPLGKKRETGCGPGGGRSGTGQKGHVPADV